MFANFKTVLMADASREHIRMARFENGECAREILSDGQAMETFAECAAELGGIPCRADAFVFCEGPGSILGTRTASISFSILARLCGAKVFAYDSMQCAAFALAENIESFSLLAPSRKGYANILEFGEGRIISQREIEIKDLPDGGKFFLLCQRDKVDSALAKYPKADPTLAEIYKTLERRPHLAQLCEAPIDAKSLTRREYVKWKAQAPI